jgi:hypothetical protein
MNKLLLVSLCLLNASLAAADEDVSLAFKACVGQAGAGDQFPVRKTPEDRSSNTRLTIPCNGAPAEALFQAVQRFSNESAAYWGDGSYVVNRVFGGTTYTHCARRIRDPQGREVSVFWCNILVDVTIPVVQALNL